jgi:hypothetical protein
MVAHVSKHFEEGGRDECEEGEGGTGGAPTLISNMPGFGVALMSVPWAILANA